VHRANSHLASVALGSLSLSGVYRQGWLPLATPKTASCCAHTFSKVCFVEAKVWCLKVADACHDRHGISGAEQ
jgi:hypothetical protein